MRTLCLAVLFALTGAAASAQALHPGQVERWFLALAPLHEARACITEEDPLRPGLEILLRDTHGRAMREIRSEYEKGVLAGRLMSLPAASAAPDTAEEACQGILARLARGLLRLHVP